MVSRKRTLFSYPSLLFLECILLLLVFWWGGSSFLGLADELTTLQPGQSAIAVPVELLDRADELASLLSTWTLATFVIVGFALGSASERGLELGWLDILLGLLFVGSAFFALFFGYSIKAELVDLLTYSYPSREAFLGAFRPLKSVIAMQAFSVCLLGSAAIYLAARGALAKAS